MFFFKKKSDFNSLKKELSKHGFEITYFFDGGFQLLKRTSVPNKYHIASPPLKNIEQLREFLKHKNIKK
jgi:hypothetical protein